MPVFIKKKGNDTAVDAVVKNPATGVVSKVAIKMGILKPSPAPTPAPTQTPKPVTNIAVEVPQWATMNRCTESLLGATVEITHEFPKEYKAVKKGDTGEVVQSMNQLYKVKLAKPRTSLAETWVRRTDFEVIG